uniref:Innexin n=1 Tax=Heterorhabditis bacteriophora TaxID=37862 RepID=A0A1I7WPI4_HETBA
MNFFQPKVSSSCIEKADILINSFCIFRQLAYIIAHDFPDLGVNWILRKMIQFASVTKVISKNEQDGKYNMDNLTSKKTQFTTVGNLGRHSKQRVLTEINIMWVLFSRYFLVGFTLCHIWLLNYNPNYKFQFYYWWYPISDIVF